MTKEMLKLWCYDKNTEILTDEGWKRFNELTKNELVFTRTLDGKVELKKQKEKGGVT